MTFSTAIFAAPRTPQRTFLCTDIGPPHNLFKRLSVTASAGGRLLVAVGDAPAAHVVGRHLDADAVADEDAYAVLPHLARYLRQHDVLAVVYQHLEEGVGLLVNDDAHSRNQIFLSQKFLLLNF